MDKIDSLFLEALRAALRNTSVDWTGERKISQEDWPALFQMADRHHVLPMIYEAVYSCPAAASANPAMMASFRQHMLAKVVMQDMRTEEALRLLSFLEGKGLHPLVVKGLVCRNIYPRPDYRISGDEDIWICQEEFPACHKAMLEFGMEPADSRKDPGQADEVPYSRKGSPIYIELHKSLFPVDSRAYGDLNRFFEHAGERAIRVSARGCQAPGSAQAENSIATLGFTDHLFYLICHAFKHFLHSGFGIRQVCDIVLFANTYGREIDWDYVLASCRAIRAQKFAASVFRIGEKYLTFDPAAACCMGVWSRIPVDESKMLADLLDAGVFGDGSMSRRHSSTITLEAVAAQKEGRRASRGLVKTVFPSARDLEGRFPYLKDRPWLLPAAWTQRISQYRRETKKAANNSAAEAVEIGNKRVDLLREYGIID